MRQSLIVTMFVAYSSYASLGSPNDYHRIYLLLFLERLEITFGVDLILKWNQLATTHEWANWFWKDNTLIRLVVLNKTTHGALCRREGRIEHMTEWCLVLLSVTDTKTAGLIVSAVGTGDKLAERLATREPGLQIVLLGGRVVQFTRDDVHLEKISIKML